MFVKNTNHVRRSSSRCESLAACRAPQMEEGGGATPDRIGGGVGAGGTGGVDAAADETGGHVGHLLVRIHVPELNVQKCLQFPRDQLVWDVKQQCLAALPKELKESFNYGLFCPPDNGRAGKFLDEERRLGDYPFNGPVGYLELKYKRRVYKMISLDEKQLKSLHTRANLRRFLDYVQNGQVEKITKMCSKGLDPNFHCQESGETPLTIATGIKKPSKVLIALVNGGALLDYRTKDGSTAVHRAVDHRSLEALRTLLELGASPNYKDNKGLTPLYYTVTTQQVDAAFAETLLHDHAATGAQDVQGWQEVHQACKNGLLAHLEHLLFYGADMNARNASGNTPLHVCAVNGQDSCARQLLFRGADRLALNYANQTPCQVAVIAGNMELAELIQNYRQEDVVPFRGPPAYNPRRRSAAFACSASATCWTARSPSLCGLSSAAGSPRPLTASNGGGSTSSASSSLSGREQHSSIHGGGGNGGGGVHLSLYEPDTASIVTDKSLGDTSDIISDSSGVGTANSDTTTCSATGGGGNHVGAGTGGTHGTMGVLMPAGSTVVCVQPFQAEEEGQLTIREGDIIEVTGATDDGFLEGTVRGSSGSRTVSGLFPAGAVQEVRMRHSQHVQAAVARGQQVGPSGGQPTTRVAGRRESAAGVGQGAGKQFATAPRTAKGKGHWNLPAEPRTVVLHKGKKGFGFILRGAKATSPLLDLTPSEKCPALQYLDDVDPGGVADMAGLRKGDFLLEINNEDVSTSSHERVVELIRSSGDLVQMTVVTCVPGLPTSRSALPVSQGVAAAQPATGGRQYAATLPRKAMGGTGSAAGGGGGTPRAQHAPLPPRRDPKTTLSVGRARAKSMVAGLGTEVDEEDPKNSSVESMQQLNSTHSTPVPPRTASIRQRPASVRIASAALEDLFRDKEVEERLTSARFQQREGELMSSRFQGTNTLGSPVKNKVYASVAEMKRSKKQSSKVRFTDLFFPLKSHGDLKRTFHSTPDLAQECAAATGTASVAANGGGAYRQSAYSTTGTMYAFHRSQEDVSSGGGGARGLLPPPTHPPPPVPVGQVIKVEVGGSRASGGKGEYDRVVAQPQDRTQEQGEEGIVSSFKPTANAKLYASPDDGKTVIYRSKAAQLNHHHPHQSRSQLRKSQSMRSGGSTFKPATATPNTTPTTPTQPQPPQQTNPYAQPIRTTRSNSTGSRERRKKIAQSKSANSIVKLAQGVTPAIPEPDYSCTDSEAESDEERKEPESLAARISSVHLQPVENSGNSNTSGSSSGSTSLPHSFSVEEIQRGRLLLKSSKSYPDDLLKKQKEPDGKDGHLEDGDNSSSGVSSDQETAAGGGGEYAEGGVSVAVKGQRAQIGMLKRHAVSLAQLPPPIENENDEKEELCSLPPPPEYINTENATSFGEEIVVAPPPQFSDNRQVTRVRIVGAVPKSPPNGAATNVKQGRLHSQ